MAAGRTDHPRGGAKARALAAVVPELSTVSAVDAYVRPRRVPVFATMVGYLLVAAVLVVGMAARRQQDLRATDAAIADEMAVQMARYDALQVGLETQTESLEKLRTTLASVASEAHEASPPRAMDEPHDATVRSQALGAGAVRVKAKRACDCTPGDPLCSCIP
jgi:hypothetical protein